MFDLCINKVLDNGTKVEIGVGYDEKDRQFKITRVGTIPKGKRKMIYVGSQMNHDYQYRNSSAQDRDKIRLKTFVEAVGLSVLNEVLHDVWELSKPKPINNDMYEINFDVSNFV